ncbi:MAG: permease prefix domain 1-containing protein [Dehalococcoidia bacterium]
MTPELEEYLEQVRRHLGLGRESEVPIVRELRSHLEERTWELREAGMSEQDALAGAMDSFGRPRSVARLLFEAHHKVTWSEVGLAAFPHLMVAFLFAARGWDNWFWAPVLLIPIVIVTLYGWWQGKPSWLYPWVGYSLIPLAIVAYLASPVIGQATDMFFSSGPVPDTWAMVGLIIYLPLAAWIILSTTIKVARRNWMLASLMLLPLPVIVTWLTLQERVGGLFGGSSHELHQLDGTMSLVHITLALTTVIFLLLRDRTYKVCALMAVALFLFAAILRSADADMGLLSMAIAGLLILGLLLSPAVIESVADRWDARHRRLGAG